MAGILPTMLPQNSGGILSGLGNWLSAADAIGPGQANLQQRFMQALSQDPQFQQLSLPQQMDILNNPQALNAYSTGTVVPTGTGGAINYNPYTKQAAPIPGYNVMPAPQKLGFGESAYVPTVGANGQASSQTIATNSLGMPSQNDINFMGRQANAGDNSVFSTNRGTAGTMVNMAIRKAAIQQDQNAGVTPEQQAQVPNQYAAQKAATTAFATGQQGNATRSFSVALDHAGVFKDLAQAMGNGSIQAINAIKNEWQKQIGSPLPTNVNAAKQILSAEMAKAIQGSDVAEGDRARLQEALGAANSWAQLSGVIDQVYTPLLAGQIHGLMRQYVGSTGKGAPSYYNMLSPRAQQVLGPVPVQNATEYGEVKSGQQYLAPDGSVRTKQ